ncbi:FAD-binding oxidoreductase [Gordonia sp. DT30]|uniref:FAD-binding oxidoreductase n=1 Tax=Gordonia sp. DT30 TaxID=3416546 RepID=UPI003CF048F8
MSALSDTEITAGQRAAAELRSRLGDAVALDDATRSAHRADRSGVVPTGLPDAVVRARNTDDVVTALAIADSLRVPVVTRGAGTGLAGGASAGTGTVVISTEAMTAIHEVDRADRIARVQAGVLTAAVDTAAARVGLRYAPDPGSVAISTVGGNIATNAGGLRCVKYGVTKDSVLGLQAVLPGGRIVETGTRTVKGVAGLDLTSLLTGSEGTLGIITEATLRLRPIGDDVATVVATFGSAVAAGDAVAAVMDLGVVPLVAELLDEVCLRALDAWKGTTLRSAGNTLLLFQYDGADAASASARAASVLRRHGATHVSTGDDGSTDLIAARRDALPALERLGRVLIEDVAVGPSKVSQMLSRIEEIGRSHGLVIATMAHAGDGNLHPIIVIDRTADGAGEPDGIPASVWRAADEIFGSALELGGTITGEHGIGILKRAWLRTEIGDVAADLMSGIKSVFDPHGIMNPGKALA